MAEKDDFERTGAVFYGSVTFNGPMFDIHDNQHVENHVHYAQPADEGGALEKSEQEVREALEKLLAATDKDGKRLFVEQTQWYAVYRVLSEHCGYPKAMSDFARNMTNMGMKEADPPCHYESLRRVPRDVANVQQKLALWGTYRSTAEPKFRKQIDAAMELMKLLNL